MAINKIQFQKGLSMSEFFNAYGTKEQCEAELERIRWPLGFRCPDCGESRHSLVWHGARKHFQCSHCRCQTSVISGTIFESTKLPLNKWFQGMFLMSQAKNNVSALELKRFLGICYRSAWRFKHKIIQVMAEREAKRRLKGRVEVDDAYLGGEKKGGKVGRGSENKVPFIAAVETNTEHNPLYVVFSPVKAFSRAEIGEWAHTRVVPEAILVTDGLPGFSVLAELGYRHRPWVVGPDRRSTEMPRFDWVNTVLGNLKSAISGTYHAFKFQKYIHRYLAEAQYRFNRRFDLRAIFTRLVYAGAQNAPRSEHWLRSVAEA
jgi:transposase-like protein